MVGLLCSALLTWVVYDVSVLQRVGWFLVDMLSFLVRNLAETDVLPGDVDILVLVTRGEVDNIHRVIGDALWAEVERGLTLSVQLVIDLATGGVTAVVVLTRPVGQVGLHHRQPSPANNKQ